jgi:glucose/arabinose dehydrogenase
LIPRSRSLAALATMALVVGCSDRTITPVPATSVPATSVPATQAPLLSPTARPSPTAQPVPTGQPSASIVAPPTGAFDPGSVSLAVEPFASGFGALTFASSAGDGSGTLYALEREGRVVVVPFGSTTGGPAFLDISDRVASGGERGLLGLAFHPDYAANGRLFVDYTDTSGNTVVSEFRPSVDGSVDAAAERVLLTVDQPYGNHNGGMLAFGPDGYLYIGLGDGGSGGDPLGNGQNTATLLGSILRIDVDTGDPYSIPADNPFAAGNGGARPEIWDLGLRNPWRFSFDRLTGALFIGDVGQSAWEEVDAEPAGTGGRNYGWNVMEADHCYGAESCDQTGLTLPVASYPHRGACSVTGGYVYRGESFPQLYGGYVFADYCGGMLMAIDADSALAGSAQPIAQLGDTDLAISAFGEDDSGELYVVDLGGAVYRLVAGTRQVRARWPASRRG